MDFNLDFKFQNYFIILSMMCQLLKLFICQKFVMDLFIGSRFRFNEKEGLKMMLLHLQN